MAYQTNDFIAETKGSCFLCSNKITSLSRTPDLKSESCPMYSLDCLSRYLKIDMKKVFTGSGPIPHHLVARVEQSRLKTELCEKCILLTRKFSKLYRQLEKTEMEMSSCLNLMQENLERAVKPESKAHYLNDMNSNTNDEWMAKLEIIEALRKDTLQKCSRKLGAVRPSTKLQRLTLKQVTEEKRKLGLTKAATNNQRPNYYFDSNYQDDNDNEDFESPSTFLNEDGNDYHQDEQSLSTTPNVAETETVKQEMMMEGTLAPDEMEVDIKMGKLPSLLLTTDSLSHELQQNIQTTTTLTRRNKNTDQLAQVIPPPIIVESGVGIKEKPDISKNPETGKYKCPICFKEYALMGSSYNHYRSVHLKVKYKCTICKKDFPFKQAYENHYLSIHLGVKFQCGKCNKSFSQKGYLMQHQRKTH